ncbi:helix-turn-helix domain-containing protein [Rhizobium mongolense]|uniref:helix-turn-helix domain-containing protein n=1 Tax=Rhizobium mongolense TaxID=57676 RepID=UPI00142EC6CE|nr:AraC family transcriptional regulator [Rhizobium mongolense]
MIAWISDNLDGDLSVEALARKASMSPRTFARKFSVHFGQTPAKFVSQIRLEAARRALEEGRLPMNAVAKLVGFGDEQGLRRAILRSCGITPSDGH